MIVVSMGDHMLFVIQCISKDYLNNNVSPQMIGVTFSKYEIEIFVISLHNKHYATIVSIKPV